MSTLSDIIYKIVVRPFDMEIKVYEYPVTSETAKSIMSGAKRFPRDELDKPILDIYVGHLHGAKMCMYETTREEVEEYGIPALRKAVKEWLAKKAEYYNSRIRELEKQE